ncbi:hypothetical protein PJL18_03911 [Paenarthrobacter nicotinovorans]|nr:hypothetical protein [Paenarthrobacter nicotinovorans]
MWFACPGDAQGRRDRMGQGVGSHAVHHVHAIQAALSGPARAFVVGPVPDPTPGRRDSLEGANAGEVRRGVAGGQLFQCGQGVRAKALEPHLDTPAGGGCRFLQPQEIRHGCHRGLFQVEVRMGGQHGQCQGCVGLDGCCHDDDVRAVVCGKQFIQCAVNRRYARQASCSRGIGVCHRNKFHHSIGGEPLKVVEVVSAESMDPYQSNPCPYRSGSRRALQGPRTHGGLERWGVHGSPLLGLQRRRVTSSSESLRCTVLAKTLLSKRFPMVVTDQCSAVYVEM